MVNLTGLDLNLTARIIMIVMMKIRMMIIRMIGLRCDENRGYGGRSEDKKSD